RRWLPQPIRNIGWGLLLLGSLLVFAGLSKLCAPEVGNSLLAGTFLGLFGAALGFFCFLFLFCHTLVDLDRDWLYIREQVGWVAWRRVFNVKDLGGLAIEKLPLPGAPTPLPATGSLPATEITVLASVIKGKGRRVLAFGYDSALLSQV